MTAEEKTREILKTLEGRSSLTPRRRPEDSKISSVDHLPWKEPFSIFNPRHIKAASSLTKLLLSAKNFDEYMDIMDQVQEYENDGLFLYTLYSSVRHRNDTSGVVLPPIEERAPHLFFSAETIHEAIQLSINQPNGNHLVANQTKAEVSEPESRLAYFREDVGMNRHHWSWHVVYPSEWDEAATGRVKDRKGELFFYMHEQMLARYDCERLANGLSRVRPLENFEEELEPYFPHMTSQTTGVHYSARPPGLKMADLPDFSMLNMEVWRLRILEAIDLGYVRDARGNKISLLDEKGIETISAVVEASSASVNPDYYGNLHIMGHMVIGNCHDPKSRFRQQPGVMGFPETTARDPVFYRWHKYIDELFNRHKTRLEPYTREELSFNGITVVSAEVMGKNKNNMVTFMRESRSELSHAPFLKTKGRILVRYEHLDHEPLKFIYKIENKTREKRDVTIRVFLGPKYDESGNPYNANEQRRLMIELDKIHYTLTPGVNEITRADTESSVTVPRQRRSYRSLKEGNVAPQVDYCTCGWPEYMLIPRGTPTGMDFVLFVMCTDYNQDRPDKKSGKPSCKGSISYCGSRDEKYPDKKPMGFPFDRRILSSTMNEFLTSNMFLTDVKITYSDELRPLDDWVAQTYGNA